MNGWFVDTTALAGVSYWYWVAAVDADGNRAYSEAVRGRREVSLSLGEEEISLDALAGSEMVDVHANTSWRAVSSASWLELTTSSGNGDGLLSYAFTHNFSRNARTATITVTAGGGTAYSKTQTIHVSQSSWNGGVSLEAEEYSVVAGVQLDGSEIVPEVAEGYTLKVAGLPSGLKYDARTGMIVGTPTVKAGTYTVTFTATPSTDLKMAGAVVETATVIVNVAYPTLTLETEAWGDGRATGSVKGGGAIAANKKVTLTATPARGYVFAGWWRVEDNIPCHGDAADYRTASYPFVMPVEDAMLVAMFATKEEDSASLAVSVEDVTTADDGSIELDLGACVESLSLPKLAVSGLPSGIRYDAKKFMLVGKAAKPGVYTATVKVTNASVERATESSTAIFKITVPNLSCPALPNLLPESDAYDTVRCGVKFDAGLIDCSPEDGWTVKAAGLPAGLKFATKETKDATCGIVPAWTIYGVPAAKAGAYTVTFTASKKGEKNQVATITLNVEALPAWVVGTFDGCVWGSTALAASSENESNGSVVSPIGTVALTVAANGKISGKMIDADGTWTLSAASLDGVSGGRGATAIPTVGSPVFVATVIGKNGKKAITNEVEVAVDAAASAPYQRGVVSGWTAFEPSIAWTAWQNLWKTEPWKTDAKPFAKASVLTIGEITLKFAASGMVAASGKFVTGVDSRGKDIVHSASCSSALIPDYGDSTEPAPQGARTYRVFLYFPPRAGKFDGYATNVRLVWDGTNFYE